jgi:hypothetical protein
MLKKLDKIASEPSIVVVFLLIWGTLLVRLDETCTKLSLLFKVVHESQLT